MHSKNHKSNRKELKVLCKEEKEQYYFDLKCYDDECWFEEEYDEVDEWEEFPMAWSIFNFVFN